MFNIKSRIISNKSKPFIIAEMSANHNGSLKNALKLVDIAAKSGLMQSNYKLLLQIQ